MVSHYDKSVLIVYTECTGGDYKYKWTTSDNVDDDMRELMPNTHMQMSLVPTKIILKDGIRECLHREIGELTSIGCVEIERPM